MKYLNNIVVDNLNNKMGLEIIETFNLLGIDTRGYDGHMSRENGNESTPYYGVVNGRFNNFCIDDVNRNNAKIITLEQLKAMKTNQDYKNSDEYLRSHLGNNLNFETLTPYAISELMENYHQYQLKAMKEDKSEYPKLMYVGDSHEQVERCIQRQEKRVVFMKKNNLYFAWEGAETIEESEKVDTICKWKFAQDIKEEKPEVEPIEIKIPFKAYSGLTVIINNEEYELIKKTKQ